jgi:hypothetical protein
MLYRYLHTSISGLKMELKIRHINQQITIFRLKRFLVRPCPSDLHHSYSILPDTLYFERNPECIPTGTIRWAVYRNEKYRSSQMSNSTGTLPTLPVLDQFFYHLLLLECEW